MISAGFNVLRTAWRKPRPLPQAPDELGKTGHGILWLDIDDMLLHVVNGGRMTGIHRYVTEVAKALLAEYGPERVRLLRHGSLRRLYQPMHWGVLDVTTTTLAGQSAATAGGARRVGLLRRANRALVRQLPPRTATHLGQVLRSGQTGLIALIDLTLALLQLPARQEAHGWRDWLAQAVTNIASALHPWRPGPRDVVLVLGAGWNDQQLARRVERLKARFGVRHSCVIHDIIPIMAPHWVDPDFNRTFTTYIDTMLRLSDPLLAISHATAQELTEYGASIGIQPAHPVQVLPNGSGLTDLSLMGPRPDRLPAPGSYVLFVSSIEPRKNHEFMVQVWQHMLTTMPRDSVPTLVFAGRPTPPMIGFLARQKAQGNLGGRLVVITDASDADIMSLYQGCLFTVFPSLYEGWGLPVTESLMRGTPCFAANNSSLPEAGGNLARYFSADDVDGTARLLLDALANPQDLADWRARIRAEFRPVTYAETAIGIMAALEQPRTI